MFHLCGSVAKQPRPGVSSIWITNIFKIKNLKKNTPGRLLQSVISKSVAKKTPVP